MPTIGKSTYLNYANSLLALYKIETQWLRLLNSSREMLIEKWRKKMAEVAPILWVSKYKNNSLQLEAKGMEMSVTLWGQILKF